MKNILISSCFFCLMFVAFSSCLSNFSGIKGNKNIVKKEFEISEYNKMNLESCYNIEYQQTKSPTGKVIIEVDENILPEIEVKVENQTLWIDAKGKEFKPTKFVVYTNSSELKNIELLGVGNFKANEKVSLDELTLSLSGVGNFFFKDLEVKTLNCYLSGVGNVTLEGKANQAKLEVSGVGNIKADQFEVQDAMCVAAGVGNVSVKATEKLEAVSSGVGNISYLGEPKELVKSETGTGKVRKK